MAEPKKFGGDLSQAVRWQLRAACRGSTDLFFSKGRSDVALWEQERAKGVCRGCEVRRHCFEAAFARDEPEFGVWAGLSEDERRNLDRCVRRVVARLRVPSESGYLSVLRRELLGLFGAVFLDADELARLLSGSVDKRGIEKLERTASGLYAAYTTKPKRELLAATQAQFRLLTGILGNAPATAHQSALLSLGGRLAILMGALSGHLESADRGGPWYQLAAHFGREAGDVGVRADALAIHANQIALFNGDISKVQHLIEGIEAVAGQNLNVSYLGWPLALRQAWVHAALGEAKASFDALERAERSFAQAVPNPWRLGHVDEAQLATHRGRCLLLLGQPKAAEPILREALALRGPELVVTRAFVSLDLATALAGQNHPEEACRVAGEALAIPDNYQVASITSRAKKFRARLEPWSAHPAVRDLDDQLRAL
jgi:WhiB family redox-sensing transcriptional regulator